MRLRRSKKGRLDPHLKEGDCDGFLFNQDISGWDTGAARDMEIMFRDATRFSQDLRAWCVPHIPTRPVQFWAQPFPEPLWGTCPGR